jgi:tetratricopeptide (TPR) repeat protein
VTVYESGVSENGEVYFAREYVEGTRLDEWWAQEKPAPKAAAKMVYQIADALAFAHRRGVIHRDIKPANIIINTAGMPQILDFGLARLEEDRDSERAQMLATAAGEFLGTFAYAAPEQLTGDPDSVDTRADVYALGILLFEALTGSSPFPKVESVADLVHSRLEGAVPKPSSRRKGISHELDLINLMALDAVPERRYDTAAELAEDLRRWLEKLPIQARADSLTYVLGKTIVRHKLASVFISTVALLVVASAISLAVLYGISEEKRAQAERAVSTIEEVLASLDTESTGQMPNTIPELLGVLEDTVRTRLAEDPEVAARMYLLAGKAYLSINQTQAADDVLSSSHKLVGEMLEKQGETQSVELAEVIHNLGRVYFFYGDDARSDAANAGVAGRYEDQAKFQAMAIKWFEDSVDTYSEALAMRQTLYQSPHFDLAMTTQHLAAATRELAVATLAADSEPESVTKADAYFDASESRFNESLLQWHMLHGESSSQVASTINSLARTSLVRGRPKEALQRYMKAYEMVLEHGTPEEDYRVGRAGKNVGMAHRILGQWNDSIEWFREALPLLERREEVSSPRLLETKYWLVDSMLRAGRANSEALAHARNIEEAVLDPQYDKKPGEMINAVVLHIDVLAAMERTQEAQEQLLFGCDALGISPADDPRVEARRLLLEGEEPENVSEELTAALRLARIRWGE